VCVCILCQWHDWIGLEGGIIIATAAVRRDWEIRVMRSPRRWSLWSLKCPRCVVMDRRQAGGRMQLLSVSVECQWIATLLQCFITKCISRSVCRITCTFGRLSVSLSFDSVTCVDYLLWSWAEASAYGITARHARSVMQCQVQLL